MCIVSGRFQGNPKMPALPTPVADPAWSAVALAIYFRLTVIIAETFTLALT